MYLVMRRIGWMTNLNINNEYDSSGDSVRAAQLHGHIPAASKLRDSWHLADVRRVHSGGLRGALLLLLHRLRANFIR